MLVSMFDGRNSLGGEKCQTKSVRVVIKTRETTYPSKWPHASGEWWGFELEATVY